MEERRLNRLQAQKTLYEILPKGAEGGKEFARIVDYLLIYEARREGKKLNTFDDAAGDYHGLDSFKGDVFRNHDGIGFQYKFIGSPLNDNARREIEKSLRQTVENQDIVHLEKWILVTPENFIVSKTRKSGGDVTWFQSLAKKYSVNFELEHWGHKELQILFMETKNLCLRYYPGLYIDGSYRKKTIKDTRKRYDNNLETLYRKLNFVGIPIYRPDSVQGVPIEKIYIPLRVVAEQVDKKDETAPRVDPLSFLVPGARHVVLGHPGSGKSTMLKFLALAGQLDALRERWLTESDQRLPIFIILRRFADELLWRWNFSLIDYIVECIQGDFTLPDATIDFFEYYLETGQAILLFDGLDELPDSNLKREVANRIRTLSTTYPGNTIVVTSRIMGYDSSFRFDEDEFKHYRLTELQQPEMEQFVRDWYNVRVENEEERERYVNDLIRIFSGIQYKAIRDMARTPLLLTIIVLVHHTSTLPDERVKLYEKCTETLLSTWHNSKRRDENTMKRGNTERRNGRRIEAIAYWMHCRSVGARNDRGMAISYDDLKYFLADYIEEREKYRDRSLDPEDLAKEFLDFIKDRTGLLVEVGGNSYGFLHLTFQDFLAASHIENIHRRHDMKEIWKEIEKYRGDSRWLEVIRLLVTLLESEECQDYLVEKLLGVREDDRHSLKPLLLGGLLLDGIEPALTREKDIYLQLLDFAVNATDRKYLNSIITMLRECLEKVESSGENLKSAVECLWKASRNDDLKKMALLLVVNELGWMNTELSELTGPFLLQRSSHTASYKLFFEDNYSPVDFKEFHREEFEHLFFIRFYLVFRSVYSNFGASVLLAIDSMLPRNIFARRMFEFFLHTMLNGPGKISFFHLFFNGFLMRETEKDIAGKLNRLAYLGGIMVTSIARRRSQILQSALVKALGKDMNLPRREWEKFTREQIRKPGCNAGDSTVKIPGEVHMETIDRAFHKIRNRFLNMPVRNSKHQIYYWDSILREPKLITPLLDIICDIFQLEPRAQWQEALQSRFLRDVPEHLYIYEPSWWKESETIFKEGKPVEADYYIAAWQLLLDAWLYIYNYHDSSEKSPFSALAELTKDINEPSLRIAHCIRGLAYGNASRTDDFVEMVHSKDCRYRDIFSRFGWEPADFISTG